MLPAITDIPLPALSGLAEEFALPPYAADQLANWLYARLATSFEEMTDLSKAARETLAGRFSISAVRLCGRLSASDGTQKLLLAGADGERFECVLIPSDGARTTVCLSTQAGCAMGCAFCRTAEIGLRRDLTLGEITGQLVELSRLAGTRVTNVVLMGMGEPLANMETVIEAIGIFRDSRAFDISRRRITLSTSGLVDKLREFVGRCDVKVAISLNATTDEVRSRIMPVNRLSPIAKIMEFAREYSRSFGDRITFEYVMIGGVNDSPDDAARLVSLIEGVRAKINLIPFNPYEGSEFAAPSDAAVERFWRHLYDRGVQVNVRASRGAEIMAACGQLASKNP
ncbi:MAG: 23S rRNA (adenine(2503)-C(2))-methyltransferase RlmN [Proteobacteria bacterium]|nr:23S rRNA (adenine(2503)-C(2))-methyltransferase RlmN [Pseudomonadota bacterium]